MKKITLTTLIAVPLAIGSMHAAIIDVPEFTQSPDGSTALVEEATDVNTPNGGNVIPNSGTQLAYFVTTFNFGTASDVHMRAHFVASLGFLQDRLGIDIDDDGLVRVFGGGPLQANSTFDLAQDLAGQSVIIIGELDFDINRNTNDDDTSFSAWINPTSSTGINDHQIFDHVWNSSNFPGFSQGIQNQSTPNTSGDSSISTRIFTGTDASFTNALDFATAVPEPSALGLIGLSGLALLLRRRRS